MTTKKDFEIIQDLILRLIPVRNPDYKFLKTLSNISIIDKYSCLNGFKTYFSVKLQNNSIYHFCIVKELEDFTVYNIKSFNCIRNIITTVKKPEVIIKELYNLEYEKYFHGEVVSKILITDLIKLVDRADDIKDCEVRNNLIFQHKEQLDILSDNRHTSVLSEYKTLLNSVYNSAVCLLALVAFIFVSTIVFHTFIESWYKLIILQLPFLCVFLIFFIKNNDIRKQREEYEWITFGEVYDDYQKALRDLDKTLEERLNEVE